MKKITIEKKTLHFKQPAGTSRGIYTERTVWLINLEENGRRGTGECAPLPDLSCDALPHDEYETKLRSFCDNYEHTGKIDYNAMHRYPSMLFGLETAVLSLQHGNALFDTPFSRGEEGITINGLVWMGTFDEMMQRIEEKLNAGFHCVKLKVGAIDFDSELEMVKHIRSRFSFHDVELRLDANGGFKPDEALYRLELLSQYAIHSIEQPIKPHNWGEMAELCRESPLPIALDEELIGVNTLDAKHQLLNIIKPRYIVIKPSLHGGMQGTREWVSTTRDMNIGSWITSALESNVGLNAVAQLAADIYGPDIRMPQGLGTGCLFTDNIPMPIEVRGEKIFVRKE